ncbi:MAG: peptidoglycan recognition family protein [Planctomycetota bacterium]
MERPSKTLIDDRRCPARGARGTHPMQDAPLDRRQLIHKASLIAALPILSKLTACTSSVGAVVRDDRGIARPRHLGEMPLNVTEWKPLDEGSSLIAPRTDIALPRSAWAKGDPVPRLMNRMLPVRRITVHHDGMNVFTSTSKSDAARRIESIRHGHRGNNWGDVGYHYLVDPAGRVWSGRPLQYQGAHVRAQNEGNLGICVLGNYQKQLPTSTQINAVEDLLTTLMRTYGVGVEEVYTHRELAATACPGVNLQRRLVAMRESTGVLASV